MEPFTGEGIGWAMASARAAVPFALRAVEDGWRPAVGLEWERAWRRARPRRELRCRLLAAALRRPWLVRAAAAVLERTPGLARAVARVTVPGAGAAR